MSEKSEFLDWLDIAIAKTEKAAADRKVIQQEQRRMSKTHNTVSTTLVREKGEVLTADEWRRLLTSGKSRLQITKETGCTDRTIRNQAQHLNLPVPPTTCRPQLTL